MSPGQAQSGDPAYMSEPWVRLGGPPGGIGYDNRMQPDNPDIMYVTDSGAGIFKSTDGGQNWIPVNNGVESIPDVGIRVFCATIDPHNYNTIWIGTQITAQIYRSTDGGQSWARRDNGISQISAEHSVRGITIDPGDSNIVYAALEEGVEHVSGIGRTRGEIYRSTNAGLNWTRIWHGDNLARYVWVDPQNTQRLFCSTGIFDRNAANSDTAGQGGGLGILRSENSGQTWTVLNENNGLGGLFIPSLFMHPENPDMLLAAVSGAPHTGDRDPGVYLTRDGGNTWELTGSDYTAEAVEISTSAPNIWYAARQDRIYRTDDAGDHWQSFPMRTANRGSGIPIDLQADPRDPYRIFVNSYGGGNMMSSDGGETWIDASRGYTGAGIKGIAVSPEDDRKVLTGANTATFLSSDGGQTWKGTREVSLKIICYRESSGPGTHTLASGSWNDGNIYHSANFGLTWDSTQVVDIKAYKANEAPASQPLYGVRAFAVAQTNPQKVYIGYSERAAILFSWAEYRQSSPGFFRSNDGGVSWVQAGIGMDANEEIQDLVPDPNRSGVIYAASRGSGVFVSTDGAQSWTNLSDGYPKVRAEQLALSGDGSVLYSGSGFAGVFRLGTPITAVAENTSGRLPKEFHLEQNYPNPFNPETTIECRLPGDTIVKLQILNIKGQLIKTLVDEEQVAGNYTVSWNGKDETGMPVSSGVYLYRLIVSEKVKVEKMVLIR